MIENMDLIYETKRKLLNKYRRMGSILATTKIEFRENLKYHTAATDGKNIYVDPKYFASLTEEERMFLIAHEILHIKFRHALRLKDKKTGKLRDLDVWNEACDAYINANLERDGFEIKKGYVNRPEALKYTAEEFYEILLKEKEEKKEKQAQDGEQGNKDIRQETQDKSDNIQKTQSEEYTSQNEQNESSITNRDSQENVEFTDERDKGDNQGTFCDDHSLWEEAFKEAQNKANKKENPNSSNIDSEHGTEAFKDLTETKETEEYEFDFDEKEWFEEQRREKREKFKARKSSTDRKIRGESKDDSTIGLGDIGKGTNEIDWKLLVSKKIESNQTYWSQRRSIKENNFSYRLEENETEEEAVTEVMIDVSGSVQLDLVKAFLRTLKSLLKESALKVGCFNAEFWGMVEIKSEKDIDNFTIPRAARGHSAWTEDWDLAVRSFTKDRGDKRINKFVFTDGWPGPGNMPKDDLKREDVTWLVYGNKNFRPCCGKVININQRQLKQLQLVNKEDTMEK